MRLTLTTFVTLDGVMQSPGDPDEDRRGGFPYGGWQVPYFDDDTSQIMTDWFANASAFLLGRTTYELFAAHWPFVPEDEEPISRQLNTLPKYVVSRTLNDLTWQNSSLVTLDDVAELKQQPGNELQIHGSGRLAQSLMAEGLIDEYRLIIYPVVLGTGLRLFENVNPAALEPTHTLMTKAGAIVATYNPTGNPQYGSFLN